MRRTFVSETSLVAWELFKKTGNPSYMSLFMNLEHDIIPVNQLAMEDDCEYEMGM